ncbi:MAG: hypothetical protein LBK95_07365 [Bifidobacteriaceae bacterium]|nr:hypothetical protein [Bifidobacteriaceae bacterium]
MTHCARSSRRIGPIRHSIQVNALGHDLEELDRRRAAIEDDIEFLLTGSGFEE